MRKQSFRSDRKTSEKVFFEDFEKTRDDFSSKFEKFLDELIESFRKSLLGLKKKFISEINNRFTFNQTDEFWSSTKNSSDIAFDQNSSMIVVKSKPEKLKELEESCIFDL